ncbi:hypothetical protein AXF42_Ash008419 [Apostasia shenzhenica]|uniref:Uncharacterized protein n=1 Tax=Apostasia shenzhenica TaxID=1088818 RepID=A0A2I0AXT4_9ASPA|nr:hypothetical protein AXF42_Ash008419 [Apostasia shenzhenica]
MAESGYLTFNPTSNCSSAAAVFFAFHESPTLPSVPNASIPLAPGQPGMLLLGRQPLRAWPMAPF